MSDPIDSLILKVDEALRICCTMISEDSLKEINPEVYEKVKHIYQHQQALEHFRRWEQFTKSTHPLECSKCGSRNIQTEWYHTRTGVSHCGVSEMCTVRIAECQDCGLKEEV